MNLNDLLAHVNHRINAREQCQIDFLAVILTRWHALGFEAWLMRQHRKGHRPQGIVVLRPHRKFGPSVEPGDLSYTAQFPEIERIPVALPSRHPLFGRFPQPWRTVRRFAWLGNRYRPHSALIHPPLTLLSPYRPNFDWLTMLDSEAILAHREIRFVLLDEGLSTYFPERIWQFSRQSDGHQQWKTRLKDRFNQVLESTKQGLEGLLSRQFMVNPRFLFETPVNEYLQPIADIVADYSWLFQWYHEQNPVTIAVRDSRKPLALFVSQSWGENGQLSPEAMLDATRIVIDSLQKKNYRVLIKPHPHEDPQKYEPLLADNSAAALFTEPMPLEQLLPALQPGDIVVGYNSTALVNARLFYEIPAFTMADMLLDHPQTGAWYREFQHVFRQLSRKLVADFGQVPHATM